MSAAMTSSRQAKEYSTPWGNTASLGADENSLASPENNRMPARVALRAMQAMPIGKPLATMRSFGFIA
jgi:hypothetical protein